MHTDIHSLYINYQTHFLKDLKVTSQEGEWSSLSKFHKNKYGGQGLGTLEVLDTGFICMRREWREVTGKCSWWVRKCKHELRHLKLKLPLKETSVDLRCLHHQASQALADSVTMQVRVMSSWPPWVKRSAYKMVHLSDTSLSSSECVMMLWLLCWRPPIWKVTWTF